MNRVATPEGVLDDDAPARRIIITGVGGSVGSRVARTLAADGARFDIVGVDLRRPTDERRVDDVEMHIGDLRRMDLGPVFADADCVVHLASAFDPSQDFNDVAPVDRDATRSVLLASSAAGTSHVVMLSSAMVYGAHPNNPLPLTEAAPLRPNTGFGFAENKLDSERMTAEWREVDIARSATVLRPTTAVSAGEASWVARTLRIAAGLASDSAPPVQFLHLDDLAAAVVLSAVDRLDGVFNVAPDGWASGDEVRQLTGRAPRLRLSPAAAGNLAEAGWRARLAPIPPGIIPYTTHPWVVANDRLRRAGWVPEFSNAEAYVEGHSARPWAMMNSKRRQQLALGAAGAAVAAGLGAAGALARRFRT